MSYQLSGGENNKINSNKVFGHKNCNSLLHLNGIKSIKHRTFVFAYAQFLWSFRRNIKLMYAAMRSASGNPCRVIIIGLPFLKVVERQYLQQQECVDDVCMRCICFQSFTSTHTRFGKHFKISINKFVPSITE